MHITLHIGAHRTGSTSLQTYLRRNTADLAKNGIGFWGPIRMRRGMMHGVAPRRNAIDQDKHRARAVGRIALNLQKSADRGITQLVVSEENILGTMRHNFATCGLYPSAGKRVAQHVSAFGGQIRAICLSVRSLDSYWASALTYSLPRGYPVPKPGKVKALVTQPRNWRDVICDISAAVPDVPIIVSPFERLAGQPDVLMERALGVVMPRVDRVIWRNARPTVPQLLQLALSREECMRLMEQSEGDRWHPLSPDQTAELRERYMDDIFWLRAGADGMATYLEGHEGLHAGGHPQQGSLARGHDHDEGYKLARPG